MFDHFVSGTFACMCELVLDSCVDKLSSNDVQYYVNWTIHDSRLLPNDLFVKLVVSLASQPVDSFFLA